MAGCELWKMIIWERLNKTGKWCPYSAEVSQLLEQSHRKHLTSACLGDADPKLSLFTVNFTDMIQVSNATGTKCAIRRKLCDDFITLGQGVTWQWHEDNEEWNAYEIDVNSFIEKAFQQGKKHIDISKKFAKYHYEIDFVKMSQINKRTKRKRSIRRKQCVSPYPVERNSDSTLSENSNDGSSHFSDILNLKEETVQTSNLERQVNEYMNNVKTPIDSASSSNDGSKKAKHSNSNEASTSKAYDNEKMNSKSATKRDILNINYLISPIVSFYKKSLAVVRKACADSFDATVALVNGKPWTDNWPPHTPEHLLKPVPGIDPLPEFKKPKGRKKKGSKETEFNVLEKYTEKVEDITVVGEQDCIICCENLSHASSYNDDTTVVKLILCNHLFHAACLEAMQKCNSKDMFIQCPSCKKLHGEKCGIQPPGSMIYHVLPYSLPSYSECDTIRIIYDIRPGTQGPEHPNPGKKYTTRGFPRHCYLPDNEMGRKVLRLLIKAWQRRLIFTIGRSTTTGEENTVTWNEIHHKTEFGRSRRGHGFPDPNFFENIISELKAHGIEDNETYQWYPA